MVFRRFPFFRLAFQLSLVFCGRLVFSQTNTLVSDSVLVEKSARPYSGNLKMRSAKVPVFEIYQKQKIGTANELAKVKLVPKLDIGDEAQIKFQKLNVNLPQPRPGDEQKAQKLPSPKLDKSIDVLLKQVHEAGGKKELFGKDPNFKAPEAPTPSAFSPPQPKDTTPKAVKVEDFTQGQIRMWTALLYYEAKKLIHLPLAMLADLREDKSIKSEVAFHLGTLALKADLYAEFRFHLLKLILDKNQTLAKKAIGSLSCNARSGDFELVTILDPLIDAQKIELNNCDQYQINRSKLAFSKNDLSLALGAAEEVTPKSTLYGDALFLRAIVLYKEGKVDESAALMQSVLRDLNGEQKLPTEMQSMVSLTLARLYFQSGLYKESYNAYLGVDKTSPEWSQAMIEQAWAQILSQDYEGAAGNMYSLHISYFKKLFNPESYVVRTVGYLNLCQYGDGAKVITDFKRKYTPVQGMLENFLAENGKTGMIYYQTVRDFLRHPDQRTYNGLPNPFVFELARNPAFINEQKHINHAEQEAEQLNNIALALIKSEKDLMHAQAASKNQIREWEKAVGEAEKQKNENEVSRLNALIAQEKSKIIDMASQLELTKSAHASFKNLRTDALARLENEKKIFKDNANRALQARFAVLNEALKHTLDQSEVLSYELYAGAGEHIRYQLAGGDTKTGDHPELKPADQKSLKWEFKGEIWDDEIGHYRSSLKNVCPQEQTASAEIDK